MTNLQQFKNKNVWNISVDLPQSHIIHLFPDTSDSSSQVKHYFKTPNTFQLLPKYFWIPIQFFHTITRFCSEKPKKALVDGERRKVFLLLPLPPFQHQWAVPRKMRNPSQSLPQGEMCAAGITGPTYFIYSFPHNFFVFLLGDIFVLVERFDRQLDLLCCFFLN